MRGWKEGGRELGKKRALDTVALVTDGGVRCSGIFYLDDR